MGAFGAVVSSQLSVVSRAFGAGEGDSPTSRTVQPSPQRSGPRWEGESPTSRTVGRNPQGSLGRTSRLRSYLALFAVCLFLLVHSTAHADTGTSLGDRSGEGTTAFTGLAQAPEANLFTGALGTSIPIPLPPGRKNMTPQLALQYSSSGGPSPYGRGWSLPIGQITRSTRWGVPHMDNPHFDEFVMMMPGAPAAELVETSTPNVYRPRVEMSWVEATYHPSSDKWEVIDRAGMRYTFGDVPHARLEVFDEGPDLFTTAWALTTIRDPKDNRIDITWLDPGVAGNHFLPLTVKYGGKTVGSHIFTVTFLWTPHPKWCTGCGVESTNGQSPCTCESYHPDGVRSYRLGVEQTLKYYLDFVHIAGASAQRFFNFSYVDEGSGHLALIAANTTDQPEQLFAYADWDEGEHETSSASIDPHGNDKMRRWSSTQDVDRTVMDMNGDGVLDIVNVGSNGFPWQVNFGKIDVDPVTGDVSYEFDPSITYWQGPGPVNNRIRNVHLNDHCGGHFACTVIDTFDITGDGIPDYIDASTGDWKVYPGEYSNSQWRFGGEMDWDAPSQRIRTTWGNEGQFTNRDTVDMTGDGLPDLVLTDQVSGAWQVYRNTGRGFDMDDVILFEVPFTAMDRLNEWYEVSDVARTRTMLADFNGDGLPDLLTTTNHEGLPLVETWNPIPGEDEFIVTDYLFVYYNTGQGFADGSVVVETPFDCSLTRTHNSASGSATRCDLMDISGDGLPDIVQKFPTEWRVLLNLGGSLEPVEYHSPFSTIRREARPPRVWPGLTGDIRHSDDSGQIIDMIDITGDGLLDYVTSGDSAAWTVQLHAATTKPSLMTMMENGLGGTNTIKYEPSTRFMHLDANGNPTLPMVNWVVSATRLNDGQCVLLPGRDPFDVKAGSATYNNCIADGSEVITRIKYEDGLFAYETDASGELISREFRGYGTVTQYDIFDNPTRTIFEQSYSKKGLVQQIAYFVKDSVAGVRYENNTWSSSIYPDGRVKMWLGLNSRVHSDAMGPPSRTFIAQNNEIDDFGNVKSSCRLGSGGTGVVCVETEYAAPGYEHSPRDRPSEIRTYIDANGNKSFDSGETLLEEKAFMYDGLTSPGALFAGDATRIDSHLINATEDRWVSTLHTYDIYGNMTEMTDPEGRITKSEFDTDGAGFHLYPTRVTEAYGTLDLVSETDYDYFLGKPTVRRGPNELANGTEHRTVYDSVGRILEEYLPEDVFDPGDPSLSDPTVKYEYDFPADPGSGNVWPLAKAMVTQRQSEQQRWVQSYVDALGRARYAVSPRVVAGSVVNVVSEHIEFDQGGNVIRRYDPYPDGGATAGSMTYDYNLNGISGWTDPFGRVRTTVGQDGTILSIVTYGGKVTSTIDAAGLLVKTETDGFGREIRTETFASDFTLYSASQSVYDGLDRLTELYQNCSGAGMTCAGSGDVAVKEMTYDTLGRKTQTVDRDSGTWSYGYDDANNLLWQEDLNPNQHLQFCYDELNRPTHKCSLDSDFDGNHYACLPIACGGDVEVYYEYDDPGVDNSLGRVTRVTDTAGEQRVLGYDTRGRQTGATRVIDVESQSGEATFLYEYNQLDQVVEMTYPDGEVVQMTYDESGQPTTLCNTGGYFYVESAHYDIFGRLTSIAKGNELVDERTYYSAAADNNRLEFIKLAKPELSSTFEHIQQYGYNDRGQITSITEIDLPSPSLLGGNYNYDHYGRLTRFTPNNTALPLRDYAYDAWGNITDKAGVTMTYDAAGAPHQITQMNGNPMPGIGYDANGNRALRYLSGAIPDQGYEFTAEDRVKRISQVAGTPRKIDVLYDDGGQQKAKVVRDFNTETPERIFRYYSQYIEVSDDVTAMGAGAKTLKNYFFGGQRVATRIEDGAAWETTPLAGLSGPQLIELAASWVTDRPVVVVKLSGTATGVAAAAVALLAVTLFLMPPGRRRRAVVGIRPSRGAALGLSILFAVGTIPLPLLIQPAHAECEGCECPTPTPAPPQDLRYYHYDHLGSPIMISDAAGDVSEQIRYHPYGKVSGRFDADDNPIAEPGVDDVRYEFTGYEAERTSGLLYANARFYDPELASFLTHDPAAQFWSPYTYTSWDPVNIVDPSGALGIGFLAFATYAFGFAVGFWQALENGASFGDALVAGVISAEISSRTAGILGPIGGAANAAAAEGAYLGAIAFYGLLGGAAVYGTVTSFQNGQNVAGVAGVVGIVFLAMGAYSAYGKYKGYVAAQPSGGTGQGGRAEGTDVALVKGKFNRDTGELVVKDVDTGIKIRTTAESGGKPWGDPIEPGTYEILDQARNPDFFRLDAADSYPRNDIHDGTGRTNFRLHGPGRTIGCIACKNQQQWNQLRVLIENTSTITVPENRAVPWWRQILTNSPTIKKFGTLKVE